MYGYKHFVAAVSNFRIEIGEKRGGKKKQQKPTLTLSFLQFHLKA